MILWEIYNALDNIHAGLDSGTECVYNIFKREKQHHKEDNEHGTRSSISTAYGSVSEPP